MLTSARILLMLILASFLVANSQGSQNPEVSTFNSAEVSSDLSYETSSDFSSDSSSESSTLTLKGIDTDSSEISSNSIEAATQFDNVSGTEEMEEPTSTENPSGYLISDTYNVSPPTLISESSLSLEELADEVLASSDDNEAPMDSVHEDFAETSTDYDLSSGMEDLSPQSSMQMENSTESDIFSGSEEVDMAKLSDILSGDTSSEITNTPSLAATLATEPEASTEVDMYSGSEDFEGAKSSETPSSDLSLENEYTSSSVAPNSEPEASTEVDISSGSEEVEMEKSSEISSDDLSSEIDKASSSSSTPSTESVFSLNVPRDVTTASPDQEGITESVKPKEFSVMPTTNEDFILTSNSTESIDLSDSVNLLEEQVSDASNTSKFVSETEPHEQKTNLGVLFGVVMGSIGAVASLATIAFMLYRRRKNNQFAHQRFFDDKNEPESRNSNEVLPTYCP